ncbi:pilus (MSHA type) biogenesis protein MshL [Massilia sp. PWRC2]|uniref:pilus (MSHA type) biogenesis protein MshL n=1 Tax=Massilia sp. PWRC2 TaxID=2804626 RepID=UPI003CEBCE19
MHKLALTAGWLGSAALVAACSGMQPPRETYDAIKGEVAAAAARDAAPQRTEPQREQQREPQREQQWEQQREQQAPQRSPLASPPPPSAPSVDALLPAVEALAARLPRARRALEERFDVSFNNVPAAQFFHSIVVGTRYNMLVHPDIGGTISANLKDVTLIETLDAVRELYGYDYRIDGSRIAIKPLTMQTRMFQVNYLTGSRRGLSSLRVTSTSVANAVNNSNNVNNGSGNSGAPGQPGSGQPAESTSVSTSDASDFWAELKLALEAIVGAGAKEGGRSVVISPQSGVLVIRAMPEQLRQVDQYLRATQLSVDRQVILEAKILEVELNDGYQSGINWASFSSFRGGNGRSTAGLLSPGASLTPLPLAGGIPAAISDGSSLSASSGFSINNAVGAANSLFGLAFQTSNFAALISFLESQGTVHVLSSPRVAAMNNQKAVLKIGTDEFYVTGVTTTTASSAGGNTVTPSVTLQPFFSGVVLDVTPQIDDKGNILLHVHPSVSQVSTITKSINLGSAGNLSLPLAASSTSEIDSMVRGQDGRVVAIGGLMRQSSSADRAGIPGAASVPVLGALFGSRAQVNQKRELVVLIKPTIVEGASSWNEDLFETGKRMRALDPAGH